MHVNNVLVHRNGKPKTLVPSRIIDELRRLFVHVLAAECLAAITVRRVGNEPDSANFAIAGTIVGNGDGVVPLFSAEYSLKLANEAALLGWLQAELVRAVVD